MLLFAEFPSDGFAIMFTFLKTFVVEFCTYFTYEQKNIETQNQCNYSGINDGHPNAHTLQISIFLIYGCAG